MDHLTSQVETLLFISPRPLTIAKLASLTGQPVADVTAAIDTLIDHYKDRGVIIKRVGTTVEMMTAGGNRELAEEFARQEVSGELTRPSLETLAIIAYRGPVSKAELEIIRGVNCSLILRNLMIRGLAEEVDGPIADQPYYQVTMDFLKYIGVAKLDQLPNYQQLNADEKLAALLNMAAAAAPVDESSADDV